VKKINQSRPVDQRVHQLVLNVPEFVGHGLHELVVGAGLTVLSGLLEQERTQHAGERYAHSSERKAGRAGHVRGELMLGGRRVAVQRPRVRSVDGHEIPLETWQRFSCEDPLDERAVEQMVIGVSTRKYARSLEAVDADTRGDSKSAVSRRFVALTQKKLDAMLCSDLSALNLAVLMLDGIHIDEHVVLVALGIDVEGNKHILGLHEGATENATACTALLTGLRDRGLKTDVRILAVIDGAKALRKAVMDVFGANALIQRCQLHKRRNVLDHLPEEKRARIDAAMAQAYRASTVEKAKRQLKNIASVLQAEHPSAAASLQEGLEETLTVLSFGLPPALLRTLATTNPIENIQGGIRRVCRRVTRWRGGTMILRWVGAALVEHARGFRRLKGHAGMATLLKALRPDEGPIAEEKRAA
jgi:putative transposase